MNWFALACELQRDWREGGEKLLQVRSCRIAKYAAQHVLLCTRLHGASVSTLCCCCCCFCLPHARAVNTSY